MGQNIVLWILGICAIFFGFLIAWGGLKKTGSKPLPLQVHEKDGVPILPRSERSLDDTALQAQSAEDVATDVPSEPSHDALSAMAEAANRNQVTSVTSVTSEPVVADHQSTPVAQEIPVREFQEGELSAFEAQSPALDEYFQAQASADMAHQRDDEVLFAHQETVTIVITPKNGFTVIEGRTIMRLVRDYAMKYGVMNMFHRYEHPEGRGKLWFSMLGVGHDGVQSFDLIELPKSHYRGLALFLSLPHPQALKGFDSMVSVAQAIAKELDADIHDEAGYLLDAAELQRLRNSVGDYVSPPSEL